MSKCTHMCIFVCAMGGAWSERRSEEGTWSPGTGGTGCSSAALWVIGIRPRTSARTSALSHWASLFVCLGDSIIYWPEAHKQARLEFSQSVSPRDTLASLPSTGIAIVCHCTQPPPHRVRPEDWTHVLMIARQILYGLCYFLTQVTPVFLWVWILKRPGTIRYIHVFVFWDQVLFSSMEQLSARCAHTGYTVEFCDSRLTKTFKRFFIGRWSFVEMGMAAVQGM